MFKFTIPQSPIRPALRIAEFGLTSSIIPREQPHRNLTHTSSFSQLKSALASRQDYSDAEHILSCAAVQVASFSRNDAETLFSRAAAGAVGDPDEGGVGSAVLPPWLAGFIPPGYEGVRSVAARGPGSRTPAGMQVRSRSMHSGTGSSDSVHGAGTVGLGEVGGNARSSMDSVASAAGAAGTPLMASGTHSSAYRGVVLQVPGGAAGGAAGMMQSVSTSGRFGLIQGGTASGVGKAAGLGLAGVAPKLPLPTVVGPPGELRSTSTLSSGAVASMVGTGTSVAGGNGGGKQLVSTMDLQLCSNLSRSGFL
ncbi:hypothetical protein BC830DRAFT_443468 [Chytriomyces sp. MP71]|nr:hypothetical protein BC830DRAFT_443468 [Chytriomyces sp. MP71]